MLDGMRDIAQRSLQLSSFVEQARHCAVSQSASVRAATIPVAHMCNLFSRMIVAMSHSIVLHAPYLDNIFQSLLIRSARAWPRLCLMPQ